MNVAVTRARKLCVLICDSETLEGNKFLKGMDSHFREFGEVRTAEQYRGDENVRFGEGGEASCV